MVLRRTTTVAFALALVTLAGGSVPRAAQRHVPTMAQFMSPAFPLELVAARSADRIAWIANDKGLRNVYTAAAPGFRPVRVTEFLKDDGIDLTQLSLSDDGTTVVFTRGHTVNRDGWVANPPRIPVASSARSGRRRAQVDRRGALRKAAAGRSPPMDDGSRLRRTVRSIACPRVRVRGPTTLTEDSSRSSRPGGLTRIPRGHRTDASWPSSATAPITVSLPCMTSRGVTSPTWRPPLTGT